MTTTDTPPAPAPAPVESFVAPPGTGFDLLLRVFSCSVVTTTLAFLLNNYLTFWLEWPGVMALYEHLGWIGQDRAGSLGEGAGLAWAQLGLYLAGICAAVAYVLATRGRNMTADAAWMSGFAGYIVRAAFWSTFLIGIADVAISFLRVEEMLASIIGESLTTELGRPTFRGTYVHYPLVALSLVVAGFVRSLGFIWLALLVVFAEFQIVIWRFVFSYEQAFMGDLVRFWYAALFLFASAYTLVEDGHVRVDVFYARFSARGKAWANALGSVLLGLPLCWVILTQGMWGKGSSLNSPLLSFEISQSGYGLYVKYLMAGFLVIFSVTMIIQFASYFLSSAAVLRGQAQAVEAPEGAAH